jgi:hypothetical protein
MALILLCFVHCRARLVVVLNAVAAKAPPTAPATNLWEGPGGVPL